MPVKPISIRNPNSEEGSKHTLVDGMYIVWQGAAVPSVLVVVPENVACEVPVIPRICGQRPTLSSLL
jgi:hypothetical protein